MMCISAQTSPGYVATVTTTNDPNYTPAANPLVLGKTYYWKINEIAAGPSTTVGDIWQFTVEGKAKLPSPVNGEAVETKADQLVTLSWTVGKNATGHDVYFGTDNPPATRVSTNQPGNTYPAYPGMGKTYYWKINEISAGPTTTVGNTWSFSTANYRLIDNFESLTITLLILILSPVYGPVRLYHGMTHQPVPSPAGALIISAKKV